MMLMHAVVAAVVTRCPLSRLPSHLCWCECWVSPLYRHYIVSRAPLSPHLSQDVTSCHAVSRCPWSPPCLVTVRLSAVRAPLAAAAQRSPHSTVHLTCHMCTPVHLTCHMCTPVHVHVCESMRNISVASSYLRERKQAERHQCLSIYVRSFKYMYISENQ